MTLKTGFPIVLLLWLCTGTIAQEQTDKRLIVLEKFSDKGVFDGARNIRIVLPRGYDNTNKKYRVIYFFDGKRVLSGSRNDTEFMAADYYHDELVQEGLIHPAILVAMHDNGNRMKDLTPTKGHLKEPGGDLEKYYDFIATVLKPYIDSCFRTMKEAPYTGIAGHSYAGLASAWLAYMHPETFGLAGCLSPSLWWDKEILLKKMADEPYTRNRARFWFMSSDTEFPDMWLNTRRAAFYLKENGWKEGENLAYSHVYGGAHDIPSCNNQMRNMLYFLLGKKKPAFTGATIKTVAGTPVEPVKIDSLGENACLLLELQYANGYKANAIAPACQSNNDNIAFMNDSISGGLSSRSAGTTQISLSSGKARASVAVEGFDPGTHEKYQLSKSAGNIVIDGKLNEWEHMRYGDTNTADSCRHYRFDIAYDERFLYIAVRVLDDTIFVDTTDNSQKRDRLAINVDARDELISALGRGLGAWNRFLSIGVSPGRTIDEMILQTHYVSGEILPSGVEVASVFDDNGYVTEIAIPVTYIVEKQGKDWNSIRFNLYLKDIDSVNGTIQRYWWRPDWKSAENYRGSGIFYRKSLTSVLYQH